MTKEQVHEAIKTAFPELPLPTPGTILGPPAPRDRSGAKTLQRELVGKTWQSLPPEFLATRWSSFCYLSPEAYCYYVPALLNEALNEFPNTRGLLHAVVFNLRPSFWMLYYEGSDAAFQTRQAVFTSSQYHAVCAFLGLVFNQLPDLRYLAAQALHWGWNRIDTPSLQAAHLYYRQLRTYVYPEPEDPQIARLSRAIDEAFATTPYPGDDKLCGSKQGDEPAEIAMELRGLKWQWAHPELLARCYTALSFLSDAGFRYFLPAYLRADLAGSDSNANPVFHLTYGLYDKNIDKDRLKVLRDVVATGAVSWDHSEGIGTSPQKIQEMLTQFQKKEKKFDWRKYSLHRFMSFNREERRAIIQYLEYRAKDEFSTEEINQALEGYWRPSV